MENVTRALYIVPKRLIVSIAIPVVFIATIVMRVHPIPFVAFVR